ncbi:MAG: hypothetical protein EOM24_00535 [Chloroflexia bacterium]|nr:hypothetical protein [Chloroflexia bacterium]
MNNREQDYLNHFIGDVRNDLVDEPRSLANTRLAGAKPGRSAWKTVWEPELGHPFINEAYREIRDTLIKSMPVTGLAYTIGELTKTFVTEFVAEAERARERIHQAHAPFSGEKMTEEDLMFTYSGRLAIETIRALPEMVRQGLQAVAEEVVKDKISSFLSGAVVDKLVRPVARALRAIGNVGAQLLSDAVRAKSFSMPVIDAAARRLEVILQEAFVTVYVKELVNERWEYAKVLADILVQHRDQGVAIMKAFLRLPVPVCAAWLPSMLEQLGFRQEYIDDAEWLVEQFRKGWGSLSARLLQPVSRAHKTRMNEIVEQTVGVLIEPRYYSRLDVLPDLARQTLCTINDAAGLPHVQKCRI